MTTTGLLLAAGAGRRMGSPKALLRDVAGVPWAVRAVRVLREGGCESVAVVVGASGDALTDLLSGEGVEVVRAPDWETGMGASLRSGLTWLEQTDADAALIHLVDLPDVGTSVVRRMLQVGADGDAGVKALARAAYGGVPGHPVLLGRAHWSGARSAALGDRGAGAYLAEVGCPLVECGDLATGMDKDTPHA